jgi:GTP cyclohydrolase I
MHEPPPALKYLIKQYPEEMYNCCYQLSGPTMDEYGLQQTSEAWMKLYEEFFDGTECHRDKSERVVARELRIQEEINAQSYYLANGGENDEPGAFVLDPE